jgi:hypothetical protein
MAEVDKRGVHLTHCCAIHGCKYGDDDCPVERGEHIGMTYKDEACDWTRNDNLDVIEQIMDAQAELQLGLGLFRLMNRDYEPKTGDAVENALAKSLAMLHTVLAGDFSNPMFSSAIFEGVNRPCRACNNEGMVPNPDRISYQMMCPKCGGSGLEVLTKS